MTHQIGARIHNIAGAVMQRIQVRKSTRKPSTPREIDTRTPSGKPLPY